MKLSLNPRAQQDLKALKGLAIYNELKRVLLVDLPELEHPSEHPDYKALRVEGTFRIRVGTYRIGCHLIKDSILVCRIGHREVVYHDFP